MITYREWLREMEQAETAVRSQMDEIMRLRGELDVIYDIRGIVGDREFKRERARELEEQLAAEVAAARRSNDAAEAKLAEAPPYPLSMAVGDWSRDSAAVPALVGGLCIVAILFGFLLMAKAVLL